MACLHGVCSFPGAGEGVSIAGQSQSASAPAAAAASAPAADDEEMSDSDDSDEDMDFFGCATTCSAFPVQCVYCSGIHVPANLSTSGWIDTGCMYIVLPCSCAAFSQVRSIVDLDFCSSAGSRRMFEPRIDTL